MKQWCAQKDATSCLRKGAPALGAKRYPTAYKIMNDSLFKWENRKGIGQVNKGTALGNAAVYLVFQGEEKMEEGCSQNRRKLRGN